MPVEIIPPDQPSSRRPVSEGAEKHLGVEISVLDHGFVYLVDYMGNDYAIEEAARVSYGEGTRKVSETEGLIRYLRRHKHTTPFEMVEFKFHAKMPLFVARQWVRHRTANINEYSARYSILDREFYIPEPQVLAEQSKSNRQGREEAVSAEYAENVRSLLIEDALNNYNTYEFLLNDDGTGKASDPNRPMLARELARMGLSLNYYTQWYWKIDLHNLFHFLNLRMDEHAQLEIRLYANAMADIVKDAVPVAWKAFEDYELGSINLTKLEKETLHLFFERLGINVSEEEVRAIAKTVGMNNKRETNEMLDKFKDLGIL